MSSYTPFFPQAVSIISGRLVILPSRARCSRRSKSSWSLFPPWLSPSRSWAASTFSILPVSAPVFSSSPSSSDLPVLESLTRRLRSVSRVSLLCKSMPEPARSSARECSMKSLVLAAASMPL